MPGPHEANQGASMPETVLTPTDVTTFEFEVKG